MRKQRGICAQVWVLHVEEQQQLKGFSTQFSSISPSEGC